jgi:hypothetical protein
MAADALHDGSLHALPVPMMQSARGHYLAVRAGESRPDILTLVDAIGALGAEALSRFETRFPDIVASQLAESE